VSVDIVKKQRGEVVKFDPEKTRERVSKLDAVIAHARRIKDWPTLKAAIDAQIEEQRQFVQYWQKTILRRGKIGRGRKVR
jgi:hypothetical protein